MDDKKKFREIFLYQSELIAKENVLFHSEGSGVCEWGVRCPGDTRKEDNGGIV